MGNLVSMEGWVYFSVLAISFVFGFAICLAVFAEKIGRRNHSISDSIEYSVSDCNNYRIMYDKCSPRMEHTHLIGDRDNQVEVEEEEVGFEVKGVV